ncbi:hypothetical protein HMPREF1547_02054 [Blautia sp. KLE 1732]|nr:hypothetical protein HMPREF1547_02054 [Blautia sp. KLE 1732]
MHFKAPSHQQKSCAFRKNVSLTELRKSPAGLRISAWTLNIFNVEKRL